MTNLIVRGGRPLSGRIIPSANKNAVLPILCATLLTDERSDPARRAGHHRRRPDPRLFEALGSEVDMDHDTRVLRLRHASARDAGAARLPQGMRSSIMLIPPLIARFGEARIEGEVKGCTLGAREIDPHIEVFQTFGVDGVARGRRAGHDAEARFRADRPLARLRLGHHHRELRPLRRQGVGDLAADQRGLRAARAGVLRLSAC